MDQKGVFSGVSLGIDPGHTTGVAIIHDFHLVCAYQLKTDDIPSTWTSLRDLFDNTTGTYHPAAIQVACEDYKVYDWKTESHSWSKVHTIKVVGLVQCLAYHHQIPIRMRMAAAAKGFMTDDKLRAWNLYPQGLKHARDAVRHAAYNAIFNNSHISD